MTLNQIIRRIKTLALDHKQVRNFYQGLVTDFLAEKTTLYPSVFLQSTGGLISTASKSVGVGYRLFFLDLVHVSEDTNTNELDVQSDMVSVAMDLLAQLNYPAFNDWKISADNALQLLYENENDMTAGCYIDITISAPFTQNVCQAPTVFSDYSPTDPTMKYLYDEIYIADGMEGTTVTIEALKGKKLLFIARDNSILYPVSNNPNTTQFSFDGTDITVSTNLIAGNRLLILYRNY